jgi:hypothetical protein
MVMSTYVPLGIHLIMISKIFSPKNWQKFSIYYLKYNKLGTYIEKVITTLVFKKNANFCRKFNRIHSDL